MIHKKLKIFAIIFLIILVGLLFIGNCKKTNALNSELSGSTCTIASSDQSQYGVVAIYNLGDNPLGSGLDIFGIGNYYLNINNTTAPSYANRIRIINANNYSSVESYTLISRLIQVQIDYDAGSLYMIIYQLSFSIQQYQGSYPQIDGVSRTMITRFNLGTSIFDTWDGPSGINVLLLDSNAASLGSFLVNYSYISYSESQNISSVNTWVDTQVLNTLTLNSLLQSSYNYGYGDGYDNGYSIGTADGEDVGYEMGYGDGYDNGYSIGTADGYNIGYPQGYNAGYDVGYDDGQAGETAISPAFRVISDVFTSIGSIMAIELVPHVPLGLFILVPLFFSALGLILWIWRRN